MTYYSNGKIYKIIDNTNDNVYVGSTCKTLEQRLRKHIQCYEKYLNGSKNYTTSFEIIKNNDFDIQLIELFPCETKAELHKQEGYWIRQIDNRVNMVVAGRTKKEYRIENKDKIYRRSICDCGTEIMVKHKARHERTIGHILYLEKQNEA
jgi:hypothetical protein